MVAAPELGLSEFIWQTRYRDVDAHPAEVEIGVTWKRVANAVAAIEREPAFWAERFLGTLQQFRFLPGGANPGGRRHLAPCDALQLFRDGPHR